MDLWNRIIRSQQQPYTPIPGTFPPQNNDSQNGDDVEASHRTLGQKIMRIVLLVPLTIAYYVLNLILFLLNWLRPLAKVQGFYDRKTKHMQNHVDELSRLLETLGRDYESSHSTQEVAEGSPLQDSYSFDSLYGIEGGSLTSHVVQEGYMSLLDTVSQEAKFGIVYLHNPLIDDPIKYIRQILCTEKFVSLVKKYQILLWFGDITTKEGLQVANALKTRQSPFLGLISIKAGSKIEMIGRMQGAVIGNPLSAFEAVLAKQYGKLIELRQQRQNAQLQRLMREQQDARFAESLRRDQERDQQRSRDRMQEQERQTQQQRQEELRAAWLLWRKYQLRPEPGASDGAARLAIRMPDNIRVTRRFDAELPIEEIYAFVELYKQGLLGTDGSAPAAASAAVNDEPDYHYAYPFRLITPVPRVELQPSTLIKDASTVYPSGSIVVETLD
ncbi:LAMI_0E02014g1_1 [Lachancea mirantina]|uniref:LAMI_0E02014g1_1 n=1 Tax=Lachancea mirantina TaxID=1230905 RepID=A0A1G4JJ07_9SACH|nr:LAMI_0E02014g1_1 [Lachancea mirantina]